MKTFKWVLSLHLNTSSVAVSSPSVIKCDLDAQIIFYISNQELETLIFWEMLHVMSWQKGRDPKGFASFSVRWPTLNRLLTDGGVCMLVWCFPLIKQLIVLAQGYLCPICLLWRTPLPLAPALVEEWVSARPGVSEEGVRPCSQEAKHTGACKAQWNVPSPFLCAHHHLKAPFKGQQF